MKLKDLWIQYKDFHNGKSENVSIQRFSEQMRELRFEYSKQNWYSKYKITIDDLNNIAKKRKWLHELDNCDITAHTVPHTVYIRAEDNKKVVQSNKYITK